MGVCLKCGGTGILVNGEPCDCGATDTLILPTCMKVPTQYQGVRFSKDFVRKDIDESYGRYLEKLLNECTKNIGQFNKNVLICAPPNSSKTIFAYTVYGTLYAKGINVPEIMDLMETRDILLNYYSENRDKQIALSTAKLAFIKVPQDLPPKFAETMSTIIERRVRSNASTIFLSSATEQDILAQDKFGKFKMLMGDGSYNSIEVRSWFVKNAEVQNGN